MIVIFIILSLSAGSSLDDAASASSEGVPSLVRKIIAAYGGKEAIEQIKSVYAAGSIEALMRQDSGSYEICFKRPGKLLVETKYRRSSETRILNGGIGYRGVDGLPAVQTTGDSLLAMVYQYKHFDLPHGLLKGSYAITVKGREDLKGKPAEVLHLTDKGGPPMDVYVDTRTYLIVKVSGYFSMPGGESTVLSAEFSDFRKVDGTVFPFRITNYAGGYRIARTTMKTYRINQPMPDSLFEP